MPPGLREEKKVRTAGAIAAAALDLFAARGFAGVTVSEIAATAGVGERTLYRYFVDKEELLFAEDPAWRESLRAALAARPADEPPFTALRSAAIAVAGLLEERRDEVRRRGAVIAAAPALQTRERAKHAAWEELLADGLRERGLAGGQARLLGRAAVACFDEAVARWLAEQAPGGTLAAELGGVFDELRAALGE